MKPKTQEDAISCTRQFGKTWVLCDITYEGKTHRVVRSLDYTKSDEFSALDGKVLFIPAKEYML